MSSFIDLTETDGSDVTVEYKHVKQPKKTRVRKKKFKSKKVIKNKKKWSQKNVYKVPDINQKLQEIAQKGTYI